jgi:putative flavoprotein involved in K+ transport
LAVVALTKEDGGYVAHAGGLRIEADKVVVAAGVFQKPHVPDLAQEIDPGITQLHSSEYRNPRRCMQHAS